MISSVHSFGASLNKIAFNLRFSTVSYSTIDSVGDSTVVSSFCWVSVLL